MPGDVKVLRLIDMLRGRRGPLAQRLVHAVLCVALRLFFRRIETSHARHVPASGALVFVLNHPNGLIDPALVFAALPRRVSFLAKSTLFRIPVAGWLLRAVEALPLYRRLDAGEDVAQNRLTFEACRALLRRGRAIALFPEGVSHNAPRLLPLKTGAARIALGALSLADDGANPKGETAKQKDGGASADVRSDGTHMRGDGVHARGDGAATAGAPLELKIVPVGLYYTSKTSFRSEALLRFGEPLGVCPVALDAEGEPPREAVRELSARIEAALREVTVNAETEEQLGVARKAERLLSSVSEGLNVRLPLAARVEFLRRFTSRWLERLSLPAGLDELGRRIERHAGELRRIGIRPENLQLARHSAWYVFRHFLLRVALLLLLAPLAVVGALLHLPAYLLCALLARAYPKHGVDEIAPTVKILAAIALMPLTWLIVAALGFVWWGWRASVLALPLSVLCGYVAMRSLEEWYDLRGWFKALLLLFRRRQLFLRLLVERRDLRDEIQRAGEDF